MRPRTCRVLLSIFGVTVSRMLGAAPAVKSASPWVSWFDGETPASWKVHGLPADAGKNFLDRQ